MSPDKRQLRAIKAGVFLAALLPAGSLLWRAGHGDLGANPVETITHLTGDWTFNFLLLTLCITPLRSIAGQPWLIHLRRMLGLYVFFYGTLHFLAFAGFDHDFSMGAILDDVLKRPFISAGFAAFVLLLPLAATSFNRAIRWLGGKRWQKLHRSTYLVGVLAAVHYFWLVKITAIFWPLLYAGLLAILLAWRVRTGQWTIAGHKASPDTKTGRHNVIPARIVH